MSLLCLLEIRKQRCHKKGGPRKGPGAGFVALATSSRFPDVVAWIANGLTGTSELGFQLTVSAICKSDAVRPAPADSQSVVCTVPSGSLPSLLTA